MNTLSSKNLNSPIPENMATTKFIHILHLNMMILRYPLLPQATTRGSTIYKPQLVDTRVGLSCYEPPVVTPSGVPNIDRGLLLDSIQEKLEDQPLQFKGPMTRTKSKRLEDKIYSRLLMLQAIDMNYFVFLKFVFSFRN